MLYGFVDTYFPPSVEHHSCKFDPQGNNPGTAILKGKSDIARFWYGTFFMSPDSVVRVKETSVHLASNTARSRIEIHEMEEIMGSVHSSTQHLPLRDKPLSLTLEGTFTMFTDENKLIDKMIMEINPHPMIAGC
eukprot:gene25159-31582_t